jgi:hypothetical protein
MDLELSGATWVVHAVLYGDISAQRFKHGPVAAYSSHSLLCVSAIAMHAAEGSVYLSAGPA